MAFIAFRTVVASLRHGKSAFFCTVDMLVVTSFRVGNVRNGTKQLTPPYEIASHNLWLALESLSNGVYLVSDSCGIPQADFHHVLTPT